MRKSVLYKDGKEGLQKVVDESNTVKEVLSKFGLRAAGGNYSTFNSAVSDLGVDISGLKKRAKNKKAEKLVSANTIPLDEILVENSTYSNTSHLKKRLVESDILDYKCEICGISEWNGKEISLHLDHINGVHNDHRIENIRLLCPNCHSQTENYAGRSQRIRNKCNKCGSPISKYCETGLCMSCAQLKRQGVDWPPVEDVLEYIEENSYLAAGRWIGVTDNAVRRFLKRNGAE